MKVKHSITNLKEKTRNYCICIPVLNEGEKFIRQIEKMKDLKLDQIADIIILDRDSSDGSTKDEILSKYNIRTIIRIHEGKQGSQLRVGFDFAILEGYEAVITVDGNGKDSVENIPDFIECLKNGYQFIQGSRYIPGGRGVNTPITRHLGVKFIHAPWISILSGFRFTDTTSAFRGIAIEVLKDKKLNIFRDIFVGYELLFYMSARVPRLGYRTCELPVTRSYPKKGKTPTKISFWGNFGIIKELINLSIGRYN